MKRTVCTLLAGALIFGVAGCNGANSAEPTVSEASQEETTTTTEETTTEGTTETTTKETVIQLDMSLDEVADTLFEESGLVRGTIAEYGSEATGIWISGDDPNRWDELFCESIDDVFDSSVVDYRMLYESTENYGCDIYIIELDTETDYYKDLEVGGEIKYTQVIVWPEEDPDETEMSYQISAINGQYALVLFEVDYSTGEANYCTPYKVAECQSLYDAFMSLK